MAENQSDNTRQPRGSAGQSRDNRSGRGKRSPDNRSRDDNRSRSDNRSRGGSRRPPRKPDQRRDSGKDSRSKAPKSQPKHDSDSKPRTRRSTNIKITPPSDANENWRRGLKTSLLWIVILASVIFLAQIVSVDNEPTRKLNFTEYQELLVAGKIKSGTIIGNNFHGELYEPETATINGVTTEYNKFWVVMSPTIDSETVDQWSQYDVTIEFKEDTRDWVDILFGILPWVLIIFFWFFLMRRMQGASTKGIFSFGKSRARVISNEKPEITFSDVAGCEEAKEELREIVSFLKHPKRFQRLGGKIPKGALLVGPPGTGKTLLARAVAGEAGVPFYSLSGADFVEMFVGVGASRVRDLFEQGKKNSPCIIFIDEMDAVGRQRGAGLGGGHDEREQTLNALLVEMDGFETTDNVILLAATNRPDVLDSALLRPGRFDRRIVVDIPDVRGREAILKVHSKNIPLAKNVRLDIIAKGSPGMSGADLANLINEAALLAARRKHRSVTMDDIESAKDKVMMGTERRSLVISESEKRTTAVHEAGHALVARLIPGADPVHKVTIIPRGQALGLTAQLPMDDRHNYSKEYIEGMLAILMGGRVAEEIVLDQKTTGAGNDIERATSLARKMVSEWGMSDRLGPMTFGQKQEEIFLGRDFGMHRDFSEEMARQIDDEVRQIIDAAKNRAEQLIRHHRRELDAITKLLLEKESIDSGELDKVLEHTKSESRSGHSRSTRSRGRRDSKPEKGRTSQSISRNEQPSKAEEKPAAKESPAENEVKPAEETSGDKHEARAPRRRRAPSRKPIKIDQSPAPDSITDTPEPDASPESGAIQLHSETPGQLELPGTHEKNPDELNPKED